MGAGGVEGDTCRGAVSHEEEKEIWADNKTLAFVPTKKLPEVVDCLLLIFSLALLVAYPFSPAYRYRLVSLDWRALHLSKDYRREINSKSRQL